jgi:NitT/TauT family transport system permease protein
MSQDPESIQSGPSQRPLHSNIFWSVAEDIPSRSKVILGVASISLLLTLWFLATIFGKFDPKFLPSPFHVFVIFIKITNKGLLWQNIGVTLTRISIGVLLATMCAIPLGILMGIFSGIRALLLPLFSLARFVPALALIPFLSLYVGIGENTAILFVFIVIFFFNTLKIMEVIELLPKDLIESAFVSGGRRITPFLKKIIPYSLLSISNTCSANFSTTWQLAMLSEISVLPPKEGFGRHFIISARFMKTDEMFAELLVIILVGVLLNLLFKYLVRVWQINFRLG